MLSHQSKFTKQRPTMADPKLTPETLYIDRDQGLLSGDWGQYIKIGIVRNDKEATLRNKEHQTGNPRRIHVIFSAESPMVEHLETYLHHIFASRRVLGEWFLLDDNAVQTQVIPIAETLIEEQRTSLEAFTQKAANKSITSSGISREPTDSEIVNFSRYNTDDEAISTTAVTYMLVFKDGMWKLKAGFVQGDLSMGKS